jgi:hypothetical protein
MTPSIFRGSASARRDGYSITALSNWAATSMARR